MDWIPTGQAVRVLDTVVLDDHGNLQKWVYTSSKTGLVCEHNELSWDKIAKRFAKFATGKKVATLILRESRITIDDAAFQRLTKALPHERQVLLTGVLAVQSYVESETYYVDETIEPFVTGAAERQLKEAASKIKGIGKGIGWFCRDRRGIFWLSNVTERKPDTEEETPASPKSPYKARLVKRKHLPALRKVPRSPQKEEPAIDETDLLEEVVKLRKHINELEREVASKDTALKDQEATYARKCAFLEKQRNEEKLRADDAEEDARTERLRQEPPQQAETNVALLLEQLDARERTLLEAEQRWASERRDLEAKVAGATAEATTDLSAQCDELMTQLQSEQDTAAQLLSQLTTVKARCTTAEASVSEARQDADQLRRQLAESVEALDAARKSAQTSLNLERAAKRVGGGDDTPDDEMAAQHAAKLRQLHNKIVFLQSSLAMETEAKHEIEAQLEDAGRTLQTERETAKTRLANAEKDKEKALEAVEARGLAAVDEANSRATHLESKLNAAQTAYADALHDAAAARRREEAAKADAQRERTKRHEAERALVVQQKDDEPVLGTTSEANKSIVEAAIVRRLENEKQYLQAQLTSEATCKSELQTALAKALEDLENAKETGATTERESAEASRLAHLKTEELERDLRGKKREHASELRALKEQLDQMKDAYAKTRDGLRAEQADHNRTRVARGELLSEASRLRADRERAEAALSQARDRAGDDLQAAKAAFDDAQKIANGRTEKTLNELRETLDLLNAVRGRERGLRDDLSKKDTRIRQVSALGLVLGRSLRRQYRAPLQRSFSKWVLTCRGCRELELRRDAECAAETATTSVLRRNHALDLLEARAIADDSKAAACAAVAASSALEHAAALEDERCRFDDRLALVMGSHATVAAAKELEFSDVRTKLKTADAETKDLFDEIVSLKTQLRETQDQLKTKTRQTRLAAVTRCDFTVDAASRRLRTVKDLSNHLDSDLRELHSSGGSTLEAAMLNDAREKLNVAKDKYVLHETAPNDDSLIAFEAALDTALASAASGVALVAQEETRVVYDGNDERRTAWRALLREEKQKQKTLEADYEDQKVALQKELAVMDAERRRVCDAVGANLAASQALRDVDFVHLQNQLNEANEREATLRSTSELSLKQAEDKTAAWEAIFEARRMETEAWKKQAESDRRDAVEASVVVTTAIAENVERREGERWRTSLREAEARSDERTNAAWRAGMTERDKLAKVEAQELRNAAEKALTEVKASAANSLQAVRSDTKMALERAAKTAAERQERALREKEKEINDVMTSKQRDAVLACETALKADLQLKIEKVEATQTSIKERLVQQFERDCKAKDAEVTKLRSEVSEYLERTSREEQRIKILQDEQAIARERTERRVQKEAKKRLEEITLQYDANEAAKVAGAAKANLLVFEAALDAVERKAASDLSEAVDVERQEKNELVSELSGTIDSLRDDLDELAMQHQDTSTELDMHKEKLAEHVMRIDWLRKASTFQKMHLVGKALATLKAKDTTIAVSQTEFSEKINGFEKDALQKEVTYAAEKQALETRIAKFDAWRHRMRDTLVNHERATLVSHKEKSAKMKEDLDSILQERDQKEKERSELQSYVKEMEDGVRSLEAAIRDHAQSSSIAPDGRINVAHAKRKRRMDDDHDALLSGIERQRNALTQVDADLAALNDQRQSKEDDISSLERRLVELLVTQQRKLLTILQEDIS